MIAHEMKMVVAAIRETRLISIVSIALDSNNMHKIATMLFLIGFSIIV
jgi:hypothetical protein